MGQSKDTAIEIRDRLNAIVDDVMSTGSQEDHIVACCVALAVEELEKWLYDGDFTPSVRPYRDDRKWQIPFKPGEDDDGFSGPPWDRHKTSIFDRYPSLAKLRKNGIKSPPKENLDECGMDDWSESMRRQFRDGDRAGFIRTLRMEKKATLKAARDYADKMKALNPTIWDIDNHAPDSCPMCHSKDIKAVSGAAHPFWCQDCKTHWGHPWDKI